MSLVVHFQARGNPHPSRPFRHERLQRIFDQVDVGASQLFTIGLYDKRLRMQGQLDGPTGFGFHQPGRFADDLIQVHPFQPARGHAGQRRKVGRNMRQRVDLFDERGGDPFEELGKPAGVVSSRKGAAQVLDGQLHGRQGVFDFVRHLPGHFAPGQLAFLSGQLLAAFGQLAEHPVEGAGQRAQLIARLDGKRPVQFAPGYRLQSFTEPGQRAHQRAGHQPGRQQYQRHQHQQRSEQIGHGARPLLLQPLLLGQGRHGHYIARPSRFVEQRPVARPVGERPQTLRHEGRPLRPTVKCLIGSNGH